MNAGVASFIVVMTLIVCFTFLIANWMRMRSQANKSRETLAGTREVELLAAENGRLKGQVGRLEERLAVLERIATDPADRTAREIEQLRQNI